MNCEFNEPLRRTTGAAVLALLIMLGASPLFAQTTVFSAGLTNPAKMILAGTNSLLVTESGTTTPNTGRISLVSRGNGARQTLIDGLPSAVTLSGGAPEVSGPAGIRLAGTKLYVTFGAGNTSIPVTGGSTANPSPSSPLFTSVLELTVPADFETLTSGFTLSLADQTTLNGGGQVTLTNGQGKQLVVRMVVNLPSYFSQPTAALPENIREGNAYDVEVVGDSLYVVDASFNLLYRVYISNGSYETFTTFAWKPNPLPIGPPVIEPVPDSIRVIGGKLYITFLTGFPFAAGLAEVRTVDLGTRTQSVFISNLTSALDFLPFGGTGGSDQYLVLEFSANMLTQAPGRLKLISTASGASRIIANPLITPTAIARDPQNGATYVTEKATGRIMRVATPRATFGDLDGDGRADIAGWNVTTGLWSGINSSNSSTTSFSFGSPGDRIVPGDYDGDSRTDHAVWRPSTGIWYLQQSGAGFRTFQFGLATDLPTPGDFDGDGRTDIAVFRPSDGTWYLQQSTAGFAAMHFGSNGDKPAAGDYDGDGKTDIAVFRPSDGNWYEMRSTQGFTVERFGLSTDKVVPADYDGDGKTDVAVYRDGSQGVWYLLQSTGGYLQVNFGTTGDIPAPGDYDGDGKADIAVFRPSTATWYLLQSTSGFVTRQFGSSTDKPIESAYVPAQ